MADTTINTLSVCSGVGMLDVGFAAGLEHLGIASRTAAYAEWDAYAAAQLVALMEAGCLDAAPVWCGDLGRLDGTCFRGRVDAIIGGFPCQPHSVAGKREGADDARWIWPAIVRIIRDSGAWLVVLENVRGLLSSGGMAPVLADLADLGFAAEWTVLSAGEVGASHRRERVFIVGVAHGARGRFRELRQSSGGDGLVDRSEPQLADPARHGGDRPYGQGGSGRGVCGDGGEVADAAGAGRTDGSSVGRDRVAPTGTSARSQRIGVDGANVANPGSGLIQEPGRGAQGRDGAGSTVAVLEYATSVRCTRYNTDETTGSIERRPSESMSGSTNVEDAGRSERRWSADAHDRREQRASDDDSGTSGGMADASGAGSQGGGGIAVTRPDGKSRMDMLDWKAESFSPLAPTIHAGPESSPSAPTSPRRLNPAFGCWLQGWPEWWTHPGVTNSVALEMAWSHYKRRLQSSLSSIV